MTVNHKWEYCALCECRTVVCGKCGNNCCNAGYGIIEGKPCDACPSAHELEAKGEQSKEPRDAD